MKHYLSRISNILMAFALVSLTALTALAVPPPFHLVEYGTVTVDNEGNLVADGTGTATHLGRFAFHRTATLKAANGDQLEASIEGTLNPETGHAVLVYVWKGGTGRFESASGTTVWLVDIG